jgi:endoglucanase
MLALSFTTVTLLVAKAAATIYYAGVAESGGEFGVYSRSKSAVSPMTGC